MKETRIVNIGIFRESFLQISIAKVRISLIPRSICVADQLYFVALKYVLLALKAHAITRKWLHVVLSMIWMLIHLESWQ